MSRLRLLAWLWGMEALYRLCVPKTYRTSSQSSDFWNEEALRMLSYTLTADPPGGMPTTWPEPPPPTPQA